MAELPSASPAETDLERTLTEADNIPPVPVELSSETPHRRGRRVRVTALTAATFILGGGAGIAVANGSPGDAAKMLGGAVGPVSPDARATQPNRAPVGADQAGVVTCLGVQVLFKGGDTYEVIPKFTVAAGATPDPNKYRTVTQVFTGPDRETTDVERSKIYLAEGIGAPLEIHMSTPIDTQRTIGLVGIDYYPGPMPDPNDAAGNSIYDKTYPVHREACGNAAVAALAPYGVEMQQS